MPAITLSIHAPELPAKCFQIGNNIFDLRAREVEVWHRWMRIAEPLADPFGTPAAILSNTLQGGDGIGPAAEVGGHMAG
jgi:hypothetical protein